MMEIVQAFGRFFGVLFDFTCIVNQFMLYICEKAIKNIILVVYLFESLIILFEKILVAYQL